MTNRPNVLIFLTDALQAAAIEPGHPCRTPNVDRLAARGVRFTRAHTVCPTCSPARASLMTGLLPHNHGVLEVEHGRDADQCNLRTEHPHWAQRLSENGYRTGYFGKWHIERGNELAAFGWREAVVKGAAHVRGLGRGDRGPEQLRLDESLCGYLEGPPGYNRVLHYGVTDTPFDERYPAVSVRDALGFLQNAAWSDEPWCCCVSFSEPNEALIVGRETWESYDPHSIPLPENFNDDFADRPGLYRRQKLIGERLSERHWRDARACYFGRITELDMVLGRLLDQLESSGQLENTVIAFLSDHGRYVGGHGFDAHNFGPFEEIYRIPLVIAGPGVAEGETCDALVGIHDLCPTLCEFTESDPIDVADSNSFAGLLGDPAARLPAFETGFAEYHGTRFSLTQRIVWRGPWKFVFNGFDFDELYQLESDPHEMRNLAQLPEHFELVASLMGDVWRHVTTTGDRTLAETHYFSMRMGVVGPSG